MAGWIKRSLGREVGLGPRDIVLDGDPAPPSPKREQRPLIFGLFYCGQMAGWIKIPLGTKIGFYPGNIVLDADPSAPPTIFMEIASMGLLPK